MSQENFTAPTLEAMNTLLPAFEFTEVITSSALGAVYFGVQRSLDRKVAIKVFSPKLCGDAAFRKSFEKTSRIMAGLKHPNLIGMLDSGSAGDMLYQVLEFVPGKSLARSTRGQVIEFGQSMALFDGICEGLAHAHEKALVHGNLNTLSILLNQQAAPKIGNFGLDRLVHTDAAVNIPHQCTAPEISANPGPATVRSDVFSLGTIFYELITGKPWGPDAAPAHTLTTCRPEIDAVLKQATAKDPAKRMASVRAFQTALKNAASGKAPEISSNGAKSPPPAANSRTTKKPAQAGFGKSIFLKVVIIIGLLFAINFAWKAKNTAYTNRQKENLAIAAKSKKAKEDARLQAIENHKQKLAKATAQVRPELDAPVLVPKEETPGQSLERLKLSLASGDRQEMPVGTVKKGSSNYFLVFQPMSWMAAAWFAEQHGGHLALPVADPAWLSDEVTKGNTCWLGAARSGADAWTLVNGLPWNPASPPVDSAPFLTIGENGVFAAASEQTPLPFVIQWHDDGSNPGALAAALAATRVSLETSSPVYPPGTITVDQRHYLFVPRPNTWEKANELAESGGGHLMVPSDPAEITKLEEMTKPIAANNGILLGGTMRDDVWQWTTGEPWTAAKWSADSEDGEENSVVIMRPGEGWDALTHDEEASGFIIEWSADSKAPAPDEIASAADVTAELTARVKELVLAADKKRRDSLAANIKKLNWDLDAFLKNLAKSIHAAWSPQVDALRDTFENDRIFPDAITTENISVSPEMAKLINYHLKKQGEIDVLFTEDAEKIRDAFVTKLSDLRDDFKSTGQTKLSTKINGMIEDSEDLDEWLESFGIKSAVTPDAAE